MNKLNQVISIDTNVQTGHLREKQWVSKVFVSPQEPSTLHQPYASRFCAAWARPRRSSSAPRSWRTDPSSWCIRHCGGPRSGCTLRLSAEPVLPGTRGSRTSPPRCWKKRHTGRRQGGAALPSVLVNINSFLSNWSDLCGGGAYVLLIYSNKKQQMSRAMFTQKSNLW